MIIHTFCVNCQIILTLRGKYGTVNNKSNVVFVLKKAGFMMTNRLLAQTDIQTSKRPHLHHRDSVTPALGRRIICQQLTQLSGNTLLRKEDIRWLSRRLISQQYTADEIVLRQGVHGDCLGLVKKGRLAAYSPGSQRSTPIRFLLPGDTFGQAMLADGRPSGGTLCAAIDSEILFLRRVDFLAVVELHRSQPQRVIHRRSGLPVMIVLFFVIIAALFMMNPTRQAIALAPYSLGLWLEQRGHTEWVKISWALTQRLSPDWAMLHLSLGNLYFRQGQLDQAKAEFEQALMLRPDLAEAHNGLGLIYAMGSDHAAAINAFEQALALEPGHATVEGNLAFSLHMAGHLDEALRHYAMARLLDAPQPILLANEAIAYYEVGDQTAAASTARQALELNGALAAAHTVLGAVDLAQQHTPEAIPSLEKAVRLDPYYSPAHFYLGLAYKSVAQPTLAVSAFEHALALTSDPLIQREAYWHLTELYGHNDSGAYQ